MRSNRTRYRCRSAALAAAPALVLTLSAAPLRAQFGDIGLSGVRGQRFANENLFFFVPENGDHFARALVTGDFNGDGADDLATGIPLDDGLVGSATDDTGAVSVRYGFPGFGLQPGLAQTFLGQFVVGSPDPADGGENFGFALAACDFDHDSFDDLAVGLPGQDGPVDSGGVQIYYGSPSGLGAEMQLIDQSTPGVPGDSELNEFFGLSLACGDFDGDTFADLAIGVPFETFEADDLERAGIVEVVYGSANGLDPGTTVVISQDSQGVEGDPETNDWFGWSLAAGNFNSDGADDLAIGVPGENGPSFGQGRGAVQLFFGDLVHGIPFNSNTYTEDELGGTPENGDQMGYSLATGNFDGDLFADLAIGVPFEDMVGGADAGQVIVGYGGTCCAFDSFQTWSEDLIHGGGSSEAGDRFGFSLASGDFDGDGNSDLAIGTPGELVQVPQDGMVTVVMGAAGGIDATRRHGLTAGRDGNPGVSNQPDRQYGYAIAAGDFDADGHADLAIGAPFEDESGLFDVGAEVVLYGSLFANGFDNGDPGFWSDTAP